MNNKKISKKAKRLEDEAKEFIKGRLWGGMGNCTEMAIENYLNVLKMNPQRIDVHYNLGMVYLRHAVRFFEKVVDFNPDDAAAHYYEAGINNLLYYSGTVADYLRAIEINPDYVEAYYNLSSFYRYARKHKQADEYLQKGLEVEKRLAKTCRNLPKLPIETTLTQTNTVDPAVRSLFDAGVKHQEEANHTQAVKCFQQVIAAEPDNAEAYYRLALSLADRNHNDTQSIVYLTKAVQLNPNHTEMWLKLAEKVRREYRDRDNAIYLQYLERVVSINPVANKHVIEDMMWVYRGMEKPDEVAACYRRLAELEPDNISALDDLASEYRRQGKTDEA
ncbi:MAG: tetratricopeptide repeat protein, partial [Bacteroidales bacterium]|nr:tetratricopeptide repeat protein [Bacteroidales bacterium]